MQVLTGDPHARRSRRLRSAGAITVALGLVGQAVLLLFRQQLSARPILEFSVVCLAFFLFLGPILWLWGMWRDRRAAGPASLASARLWVPIAASLLVINFVLSVGAIASQIPHDQVVLFAASQVIVVPGIFAVISLVPARGRCFGRAAKAFSIGSLLLTLTYL